MYEEGQGVALDYIRAHMWFNLSAASGYGDAIKGRDIVAKQMTLQQITKAQKMANNCQQQNFKIYD